MINAHTTKIWVGLALLGLTAASIQADTITLKHEAYVRGPKVRLGDVADIDGENAEALALIEVAPAALPGNARSVNSALVLSRIRDAGIDTSSIELNGRRVLATTLHLDITKEMIAEDLRNFVETEMPWDPSQTLIDVVPPPQAFAVPDGNVEFRWHTAPQYGYLGLGTLRGEVLVDGQLARTFYGKVNVQTYGDVVVADAEIERGEILSAHNLRLEKRELSTLAPGAFFSIVDVQGNVAKAKMMQGQTLTQRKVAAPILVKRNQVVVVETRGSQVTIRSHAIALADAAAGDGVTCRGAQSKRQFIGIVQADGTVLIP